MKKKIFIATPTTGSVVDSQAYFLREILDTYKDHVEFIYPTQCVRRIFHDYARNCLVEDFLASDADVMWFLDSDITPSVQVLDLVALHWDKWELAGSPYPIFMMPPSGDVLEVLYTTYTKNPETGNYKLGDTPRSGIQYVDGLATGCLFIKRSVFDKLEKPYFEFKYDPTTRHIIEGEDLGFIRKVNEKGLKFLADFSVTCRHQKTIDLLDVHNYAITYANRQVLAYDSQIKADLKAALTAQYNKGVMDACNEMKKASEKKKSGIWLPK